MPTSRIRYWIQRSNPAAKAHIWYGTDTACGLLSTLAPSVVDKYAIRNTTFGKALCKLCEAQFEKPNEAVRRIAALAPDRPLVQNRQSGRFVNGRSIPDQGWTSRTSRKLCYVYFIQSGQSGPIKIGCSNDPKKRLMTLQISSYEELRIIGLRLGTEADEAMIQRNYSHLHIRGEWFHPGEELLKYIRRESDRHESFVKNSQTPEKVTASG